MAQVTIIVDGREHKVRSGLNLLHACLEAGIDLPHFCWHPALGSVGACRQCAVKQLENPQDEKGQIVMACMTPAKDGSYLSVDDPEVQRFRARVIEWLMVNHPHDCPVCDEGGECHLQDMTVMTGHEYRRYRFSKRTYRNQQLGPFIHHEMNRCIQCYRCVRFYRDHAGGDDLDVFGCHDHVYFGRAQDGVLESPFAGNLVEVCPTGVFTDKLLRRQYARKWDLQSAPSLCVHCGLGCNTLPGARDGSLRRVLNRYHPRVNGYFICDRGRFGAQFVNHGRRLVDPQLAHDGRLGTVSAEAALDAAAERLGDCRRVLGIGSPRASLEANFALKTMVGPERFCNGVSRHESGLLSLVTEILARGPAGAASLDDAERADAVLVLGEDLGNTAARAELALRQAVKNAPMAELDGLGIPGWHDAAVRDALQNRRGPLYLATAAATSLDPLATAALRRAPADIARFGFAVAHALDGLRPTVPGLDRETSELAEQAAAALDGAERPLVVAGISLGSAELLEAAAAVGQALGSRARQLLVVPECNSLGAALLGGVPLEQAAQWLEEGDADAVVVLENDLFRRHHRLARQIMDRARTLVVLDHRHSPTVDAATVALPAASFAESSGTLVNNEGRAQRFVSVLPPSGELRASWRWLSELMKRSVPNEAPSWNRLDDVVAALASAEPAFAKVTDAAPGADLRLAGGRVPRETPRVSGRTAIHAQLDVREVPPPVDPDSALSYSMEGSRGQQPAALLSFDWAPGWSSGKALPDTEHDAGVRLLDDSAGDGPATAPAATPPPAFTPADERWLLLPWPRLFGSEELSSQVPEIAGLALAPTLALTPEDAQHLGLATGEPVTVHADGLSFAVTLQIDEAVVPGTALLTVGLDGVPALDLPALAELASGEPR